jgi:hypothetical protein
VGVCDLQPAQYENLQNGEFVPRNLDPHPEKSPHTLRYPPATLLSLLGTPGHGCFFSNLCCPGPKGNRHTGRMGSSGKRSRVFAPWRPFHHPQLGEAEIGGIDPLRGIMNPPEKEIAPICRRMSSFAIALASTAPRLEKDQSLLTHDGLYAVRSRRVRRVIIGCSTAPPAQAVAIHVPEKRAS